MRLEMMHVVARIDPLSLSISDGHTLYYFILLYNSHRSGHITAISSPLHAVSLFISTSQEVRWGHQVGSVHLDPHTQLRAKLVPLRTMQSSRVKTCNCQDDTTQDHSSQHLTHPDRDSYHNINIAATGPDKIGWSISCPMDWSTACTSISFTYILFHTPLAAIGVWIQIFIKLKLQVSIHASIQFSR